MQIFTEELVVLNNNSIQIVKDQFELVGKKYMGHLAEIITRNKELETAFNNIKTQTELTMEKMKYEHNQSTFEYKLTIEKQEKEIMKLNYENQILTMKLQLQNK